eukprot:TRINITY_DN17015_c0_g1_i1.p1 TRINITY_DN17015_c0_g1~~TRINITY_DN17015_c0_g1_i1.p1  ORF type:complete len:624 (+),score=134.51 TRINITY_DN17015_c0_g1_i1:71-1942(+)
MSLMVVAASPSMTPPLLVPMQTAAAPAATPLRGGPAVQAPVVVIGGTIPATLGVPRSYSMAPPAVQMPVTVLAPTVATPLTVLRECVPTLQPALMVKPTQLQPQRPALRSQSFSAGARHHAQAPLRQRLPSAKSWSYPSAGSLKDVTPWLQAAKEFEMNTDFDIVGALQGRKPDLDELFTIMKNQSAGKRTIQALGDKLILSAMLENLSVPQMPLLFASQRAVDRKTVYDMVEGWERQPNLAEAFDVVAKPTHMSNGAGTVIFDRDRWLNEHGGWNKEKLFQHIKHYLEQRASDGESEALKSLQPGFIVQPRYRSVLDFKTPLEIRVVTLWGKARMGIWWWGKGIREERRNTWIVRRLKSPDAFRKEDDWDVLHEHSGANPGFDKACALFKKAMPAMAAAAEGIATAVGAPFLRCDFFVGSEKWGVRLNEVAYGSGTDYKQRADGYPALVDDGPSVAHILREGMSACYKRYKPDYFLEKLGTTGQAYEMLQVQELPERSWFGQFGPTKLELPAEAVQGFEELAEDGMPSPMGEDGCTTKIHAGGATPWDFGKVASFGRAPSINNKIVPMYLPQKAVPLQAVAYPAVAPGAPLVPGPRCIAAPSFMAPAPVPMAIAVGPAVHFR